MPIAEIFERCKEFLKNPKVWIPLVIVAVIIFGIVCGVMVNNRHKKAINKPANMTEKLRVNDVNLNISSTLSLDETTQEPEVETRIVMLNSKDGTENSTNKESEEGH